MSLTESEERIVVDAMAIAAPAVVLDVVMILNPATF